MDLQIDIFTLSLSNGAIKQSLEFQKYTKTSAKKKRKEKPNLKNTYMNNIKILYE